MKAILFLFTVILVMACEKPIPVDPRVEAFKDQFNLRTGVYLYNTPDSVNRHPSDTIPEVDTLNLGF